MSGESKYSIQTTALTGEGKVSGECLVLLFMYSKKSKKYLHNTFIELLYVDYQKSYYTTPSFIIQSHYYRQHNIASSNRLGTWRSCDQSLHQAQCFCVGCRHHRRWWQWCWGQMPSCGELGCHGSKMFVEYVVSKESICPAFDRMGSCAPFVGGGGENVEAF